MKRFRDFIHHHFAQFGIAGSIVVALALYLPRIGFINREGQPYSALNHFVSELGWIGVSDKAILFNLGLILGGLCYAVFMLGLGRQFRGFWGCVVSILGAIAAVFASLVGIFPVVDHWPGLIAHLLMAGALGVTAFWAACATIFMVLFHRTKVVPKPFALLGGAILLSFATGLSVNPAEHVTPFFDFETNQIVNRSDHWRLPIVEWVIVWTVVGALTVVALYFEIRRRVVKTRPDERNA
ncbi:MAG: DUF998 domain-containing protein [Verrucomicrobiales bacterium]|nr:DUF998 domain-containing protein [Verrucomicrobiales bacterium]